MRLSWSLLGAACLLLACGDSIRAQPPTSPAALAAKIDEHLAKRWAEVKAPPPRAEDAEFVRRAYLDLAGRIPSVAETRLFLADEQAERWQKLIDRLLA